jgi:hypothetical protein
MDMRREEMSRQVGFEGMGLACLSLALMWEVLHGQGLGEGPGGWSSGLLYSHARYQSGYLGPARMC